MKKIKTDYKRIIEEGMKLTEMFIPDSFLDNYTFEEIKRDFGQYFTNQHINENILLEMIVELSKQIMIKKKYDLLAKLIKKNNTYIRQGGYDKMSEEELEEEFKKDITVATAKIGVTANMLLLYYFSNNIFNNERVEFLKEQYKNYLEKIESEENKPDQSFDKLKEIIKTNNDKAIQTLSYLKHYKNGDYKLSTPEEEYNAIIKDELDIEEYDKEYFLVKKGIIYFFFNYYHDILELKDDISNLYNLLVFNVRRILKSQDKVFAKIKDLKSTIEKNAKLENTNKKLKKHLQELEKKFINTIKNKKEEEIIKQNKELFQENYQLKLKIEELEEQVKILQEEEEINETIDENIGIIDAETTQEESIFDNIMQYKNIAIVGGRWNSSKRKSLAEKYPLINFEFIKAEETLRKIDKIKNSDLVLFDTSYNAHAYYYKVKSVANELIHINSYRSVL
jgi:hypothetical protein